MQLKISTLLAIVALLFIYYFYFLAPSEKKMVQPSSYQPQPQQHQQLPPQPPHVDDNVTILDVPMPRVESFAVTSIEDLYEPEINDTNPYANIYSDQPYDLAGNVRPDNVLIFDEKNYF